MRFFIECSFDGTPFHGWQKQNGQASIQEIMENTLKIILRVPALEITGCGRTDSGVHALQYFAHFDHGAELPPGLEYHWNAILPREIAVQRIWQVSPGTHARYDAISRTYQYHIHQSKSPFLVNRSFCYRQYDRMDLDLLQQAANLLLTYTDFLPFCRSHSSANHYGVSLKQAEWQEDSGQALVLTVTANRFLRGMVRLITGMCLNVATGALPFDEVKQSLDTQTPLSKSWSVPAHGLYLKAVSYEQSALSYEL